MRHHLEKRPKTGGKTICGHSVPLPKRAVSKFQGLRFKVVGNAVPEHRTCSKPAELSHNFSHVNDEKVELVTET